MSKYLKDMHKRPLAVISIFFIIGIALARFLPVSFKFLHMLIVTLIFILSIFIFSRYQKISNIFLLLSVSSFAALLYVNSNVFPNNHISHFLGEGKLKTSIVGVIRSPALTRNPYYGKINSTYLLEIEGLKDNNEWLGVKGLAQVRIQTEKDYTYGDRLFVSGTIKKPHLPLTPKGRGSKKKRDFNYREYLERQNIFAIINTKEHNAILLAHNYRSNPILKYTYMLREKLKNQFIEKMPLESGAFLRAILLGDRSELPKHIQAYFKNSGTMHVLAISGLHIGLIAFLILSFFKILRLPRAVSYLLTILFLVFFAIFTLSRPSVVRAVVMACIFLVGMLLGRKVDVYNSLGIAALFILTRNPKDLYSVGFQLSFLAVLSILYLVPKFMNLVRKDTNFYIKRYVCTPWAVSIAAWLGTTPLILWYFGMIVPVAIVANIFVIPVLSVLLAAGLLSLFLGWVPFLGGLLVAFNDFCANIIFYLADFFASLKFGHFYL